MATTLLLIALIFVLILANGVFSMAEIAIIAARRLRLEKAMGKGSRGARLALELRDSPNRFLSTVQIGITLIGIVTGVFSGATIADELGVYLDLIPQLNGNGTTIAFILLVLLITFLSLVFGELVPKRMALSNPERIAIRLAPFMHRLSLVMEPFVKLLGWSTSGVLHALRVKPSPHIPVTEEDVKLLIEQATRAGEIQEMEQDIVERVFIFGDQTANSVMTPRSKVLWFDIEKDYTNNWKKLATEGGHSYFPVSKGSLDNIMGVVSVKELWFQDALGKLGDLKHMMKKPLLIDVDTPALQVIDRFRRSGNHLAVVIDKHKRVRGVLTLIDILESIVGDVEDLKDLKRNGSS